MTDSDDEIDEGERTLPDSDLILDQPPEPTIPVMAISESALDRAVRLGGLPSPRMRTGSTIPQVIDPDEVTAFDPGTLAKLIDPAVTMPGDTASMGGVVPMDFDSTTGKSVKPNLGSPVPIHIASTAVQKIDLSLVGPPAELTDQRPIVLSEQTDPNGAVSGWEGLSGTERVLNQPDDASALAGVLSAVALAEVSVVSKAVARSKPIVSASTVPKKPLPAYDEGLQGLEHDSPEETAPALGVAAADKTMPLARLPTTPVPRTTTPSPDPQAGVATMPLPGVPSPVKAKPVPPPRKVSVVHVTAAVLAVLAVALVVIVTLAT